MAVRGGGPNRTARERSDKFTTVDADLKCSNREYLIINKKWNKNYVSSTFPLMQLIDVADLMNNAKGCRRTTDGKGFRGKGISKNLLVLTRSNDCEGLKGEEGNSSAYFFLL